MSAEPILVSTSRALLAVADGEVRLVHEGSGLYFGIAHLGDRTYVGCHHQLIASPSVAELDAQQGSLLEFDAQLRPVADHRADDRPLRQPHGVAAIEGRLWLACSYDDEVAIFDPSAGGWERWVPDRGHGPPRTSHDDRFHYNAIAPIPGGLRLLAHNYGRSQVLTYSLPDRELLSVQDLGIGSHDLFEVHGATAVLSSLESAVRTATGGVRRVGGFPRGVASVGDGWWVGMSEYAGRGDRHQTTGAIHRLDRDWNLVEGHALTRYGQVLDIARWPGDPDVLDGFPVAPATVRLDLADPSTLEARGYRVPLAFPPLANAEWHDGEADQQWMAARRASVPIVVNPGDRRVRVEAVEYRGAAPALRVSIDGIDLGGLTWDAPGEASATFALPAAVADPTEAREHRLVLETESLWQPDGDERRLGSGLRSITFPTG